MSGPPARIPAGVLPAILLFADLAGCARVGPTAHAPTGKDPEPQRAGDAQVLALARDTDGPVALSLWIDAGSRDADPPQLATVAAFVAAERAGDEVEARVLPDGTELRTACPPQELSRCVGALATALGSREVPEDALLRARQRLVEARRTGRADEGRRAHQLALRALFGEPARAMFPLGRAEQDGRVTADAVEGFLARHYGATRSLVAAVGRVQPQQLADGVAEAFDGLPEASGKREPRALPGTSPGVTVEVGGHGWLSAAVPVDDTAHGATIAHALVDGPLQRRLARGDRVTLEGHAFDLRGGSVLLVRVSPVHDLRHAARELAFELGRLRLETRAGDSAPPPPEEPPAALTRALGETWVTEGPSSRPPAEDRTREEPPSIALGAVLAGGRADHPDRDDPDAIVRQSAEGRLRETLRATLATLAPEVRGPIHDDGASVVLGNGARIHVRRRPGHQRVRISLRIRGGAGHDPPSLHGRTALLATTMAQGCGSTGPDAWRLRLREIDARARPVVTREAFGLVLDAPRRSWARALDLALACASAPDLDRRAVSAGRLALLEGLAGEPPFRAWVARAVAPDAPGLLAPWGTPDTLAHIQRGDVARAWERRVVGARVGVILEGEVPAAQVVRRAARRLARLEAGSVPPSVRPGAVAEGPLRAEWSGQGVAALVAWRLSPEVNAAEARRGARTLGRALEQAEGARLLWTGGGRLEEFGWAALALGVAPEDLPGLPERVEEATASLRAREDETGAPRLDASHRVWVLGRGAGD